MKHRVPDGFTASRSPLHVVLESLWVLLRNTSTIRSPGSRLLLKIQPKDGTPANSLPQLSLSSAEYLFAAKCRRACPSPPLYHAPHSRLSSHFRPSWSLHACSHRPAVLTHPIIATVAGSYRMILSNLENDSRLCAEVSILSGHDFERV